MDDASAGTTSVSILAMARRFWLDAARSSCPRTRSDGAACFLLRGDTEADAGRNTMASICSPSQQKQLHRCCRQVDGA
jgi:hypothetical protein